MIWRWWQISDVHGNVVHTDKRFVLKLKGKVYTIIHVIYVYVLCEKLSLYVILVRGVLVYDLQYRVSFYWYSIIVIMVPAGHVTAATRTDPLYSQGACRNDFVSGLRQLSHLSASTLLRWWRFHDLIIHHRSVLPLPVMSNTRSLFACMICYTAGAVSISWLMSQNNLFSCFTTIPPPWPLPFLWPLSRWTWYGEGAVGWIYFRSPYWK